MHGSSDFARSRHVAFTAVGADARTRAIKVVVLFCAGQCPAAWIAHSSASQTNSDTDASTTEDGSRVDAHRHDSIREGGSSSPNSGIDQRAQPSSLAAGDDTYQGSARYLGGSVGRVKCPPSPTTVVSPEVRVEAPSDRGVSCGIGAGNFGTKLNQAF